MFEYLINNSLLPIQGGTLDYLYNKRHSLFTVKDLLSFTVKSENNLDFSMFILDLFLNGIMHESLKPKNRVKLNLEKPEKYLEKSLTEWFTRKYYDSFLCTVKDIFNLLSKTVIKEEVNMNQVREISGKTRIIFSEPIWRKNLIEDTLSKIVLLALRFPDPCWDNLFISTLGDSPSNMLFLKQSENTLSKITFPLKEKWKEMVLNSYQNNEKQFSDKITFSDEPISIV